MFGSRTTWTVRGAGLAYWGCAAARAAARR